MQVCCAAVIYSVNVLCVSYSNSYGQDQKVWHRMIYFRRFRAADSCPLVDRLQLFNADILLSISALFIKSL